MKIKNSIVDSIFYYCIIFPGITYIAYKYNYKNNRNRLPSIIVDEHKQTAILHNKLI